MPRRTCRSIASPSWLALAVLRVSFGFGSALAQDVSVTRLPIDTDMTVRLTNLTSHVSYDRAGDSYFIVPAGRYSIQLLRDGQVAYQEVEFIGPNALDTRTVNPKRMEIVVGLPEDNPQFDSTVCAALEIATRLTVSRYGLHDADVEQRLARADPTGNLAGCATSEAVDATGQTVTGSYGITLLGMVGLSMEFTPLAPQARPRNRGNSPIYKEPWTQSLATTQQPASNLTPSLVSDLKNGISDVAVDDNGKPLLVCAALDANTPLFCDSNGFAVATPAIAHLHALYRFRVKTTPVDHFGVEADHWTTVAGEDEYHATQQKLAADSATLRQNLEQGIAQLDSHSVSVPSVRFPGQMTRYYPTPELTALIATVQKAVDAALKSPTLQPLRTHFPPTLAQIADPSQPATRDGDAQTVFSALRNVVAGMQTASNNLGIDFVFRTTPVETEGAYLSFAKCDRCTPILSQGGEHRFYRGKYYIRATLDGYLPYEGWLDLIDDPRNILECEMVRMHKAGGGRISTCSLRAQ